VFRALAELLASLEVTVLAVEDVHWADEATLEFLLFLQSRVSLVVTYRPEDVPVGSLLSRLSSRPVTGTALLRLTLAPLDAAGTASLASSMLGGEPVSADFAGFLYLWTEGLPLAVEELRPCRLPAHSWSGRPDLNRRPLDPQARIWCLARSEEVRRRVSHLDKRPG
jgi:predicted ATPase